MSGVPNELLKDLFKNYSHGLKYYCVNNNGTIEFSHNIDVDGFAINKNGNVFVGWHNNAYDDIKCAPIDNIDYVELHKVYGVFSNDSNAYLMQQKLDICNY